MSDGSRDDERIVLTPAVRTLAPKLADVARLSAFAAEMQRAWNRSAGLGLGVGVVVALSAVRSLSPSDPAWLIALSGATAALAAYIPAVVISFRMLVPDLGELVTDEGPMSPDGKALAYFTDWIRTGHPVFDRYATYYFHARNWLHLMAAAVVVSTIWWGGWSLLHWGTT